MVDARKEPLDSKLIGNGSTGNVMLMLKDYQIKGPSGKVTKEGTSVMLTAVQVTDLIEYVKQDSDYEAGSEFGDDTASDGNGGSTRVPASAKTKEAPKAKSRAKPQEDEDDSSDLPF